MTSRPTDAGPPTIDELAQMVEDGELEFVLVGGMGGGPGGGSSDVSATLEGQDCVVQISPHSGATGGIPSQPLITRLGADCTVTATHLTMGR